MVKYLITGGCGFVGSNLAIYLKKRLKSSKISSLDNLFRNGSKVNQNRLKQFKIGNYKINIQEYLLTFGSLLGRVLLSFLIQYNLFLYFHSLVFFQLI